MLAKLHLLNAVNWVRNGGKGWYFSEEDGLAYSFSVFDHMDVINTWADRVMLYPTTPATGTGVHPFSTCAHILVGAIRDAQDLRAADDNTSTRTGPSEINSYDHSHTGQD